MHLYTTARTHVLTFVHSYILTFLITYPTSYIRTYLLYSYTLACLFLQLFILSSLHTFIHSYIPLYIHQCMHAYILAYVLRIHSNIHTYRLEIPDNNTSGLCRLWSLSGFFLCVNVCVWLCVLSKNALISHVFKIFFYNYRSLNWALLFYFPLISVDCKLGTLFNFFSISLTTISAASHFRLLDKWIFSDIFYSFS